MKRCLPTLLFATSSLFAQQPDDGEIAAKLGQVMQSYHDAGLFDGSVLIAVHGKVLLHQGYGLANWQWQIPNAKDTRFAVASVSKVFTATAILQLIERGKIDLDASLATYLPKFSKTLAEAMSIRQLLLHNSGLKREAFSDARVQFDRHTRSELLAALGDAPLRSEPGTRYAYSNAAFSTLALVVEAVSGQGFEEYVAENLLGPAGMVASNGGDAFIGT